MRQRTLFTVGHSTRAWSEFVSLLKAWRIEELVDVRTVPRSRTFPWFSKQRMEKAMAKSGIEYVHLPQLGGFRHSKKASVNAGWQNAQFRAYADYMQTKEFEEGLEELNRRRKKRRVCVMCSEALWWRCHRRMIADAEVTRDSGETCDERKVGQAPCADRVCSGCEESRPNADDLLSRTDQ